MSSTIATASYTRSANIGKGAISGIIAGVVFGIMMSMMGLMTVLASMVGSSSAAVGWMMHLMISAVFGSGYALLATKYTATAGSSVGSGMVYGFIVWIVGPLIMMPLMLGMSGMIFHMGSDQMLSLMGHLIYGAILGFAYHKLIE